MPTIWFKKPQDTSSTIDKHGTFRIEQTSIYLRLGYRGILNLYLQVYGKKIRDIRFITVRQEKQLRQKMNELSLEEIKELRECP